MREQDVGGDRADDDHDERAWLDALDVDLLDISLGADLDQCVAEVDHEIAVLAHRLARRGCERYRLQHGEGARQAGHAQHLPAGANRPVGADDQGKRAEQLGHVDPLRDVTGRHGAACLADQPHLALAVEQDVVAREAAVRDLIVMQGAHRAPRLLQIVVADLLWREIAEARRDGVVVGEQRGVGADLAGDEQARDGCIGCLGGVGHECRVVELTTHVEGAAPGVITQAQGLPRRARKPGPFKVTVEDHDLQGLAVACGGDVATSDGCLPRGPQHRERIARARHRLRDLGP